MTFHYTISKSEALLRHSDKRAWERFGIDLRAEKRLEINAMIYEGRAKVIQRRSLRSAIYELTIDGKLVHVVYDHKRHMIVTFLEPSWADDESQQSVRRFSQDPR